MQMQTYYLHTESNPPLHYWVMYAVRQVIPDGKTAGIAINLTLFVLTISAIFGLCRRQSRPLLGLWLCTAFLLSASVLAFAIEVRAYFLTQCLCALGTCLAILSVILGKASARQWAFAFGLGLLIGISHVYGPIYGGALAAALVLIGLARRQYTITFLGLALGMGCVISFTAWWISLQAATHGVLTSIAWLNDPGFKTIIWPSLIEYGIGSAAIGWIGLAGLVVAILSRVFRQALPLFALTLAVFAILPAIGSQFYPMLSYTYLLLAEPPFAMLLAYAIYVLASDMGIKSSAEEGRTKTQALMPIVSLIGGCVALFSVLGSWLSLHKPLWPYWTGIDRVRSEAAQCPSRTIRTYVWMGPGDTKLNDAVMWNFDRMLAPSGLKAEDSKLQSRDVSDIDCRVVGWAEHLVYMPPNAPISEAEALKLLNLTNRAHIKLKIERHPFGLVILKADQTQTK